MDSLERLRRLVALRPHKVDWTGEGSGPPRGEQSPSRTRPTGKPMRLSEAAPGMEIDTPVGACYVSMTVHPLSDGPGARPPAALSNLAPMTLVRFHPPANLERSTDFRNAIFLDTETTGLGAGTGVYAFMVGIGRLEDVVGPSGGLSHAFVVRQFFMRSPAEEPALLSALAELLQGEGPLVTFNGRTFDVPLLRTRFALNRRWLPENVRKVDLLEANAPHLDLLHPARRLWKRRLQSCRLINLEEHILGATRDGDDVPGWLIPQLYVDFLRNGDARPMGNVFYHNREDIVSTASLAVQVCRMLEQPHADDLGVAGLDWLSLGVSYDRAGRPDEAVLAYQRTIEQVADSRVQAEAFRRLASLHKRTGNWPDAVATWERWLTTVPGADATPYIELAKYWEWTGRDLERAAMWAAFGLHTVQSAPQWQRLPGQMADLEQRIARLSKKLLLGSTAQP